MKRGSQERLGYRQVWLGRLWRQAGWGGLQLVWVQDCNSISQDFGTFLEMSLPCLEALVLPVQCGVRDGFWGLRTVPFPQGWEGQRMLGHLSSIALGGFVPKGLFPLEKEGKISADQHWLPRKLPG